MKTGTEKHLKKELVLFLAFSRFNLGGMRMKRAGYFRQLARRCRVLSKAAVDPEVIEQMRVWTVDFADEADEAERRAVERGPLTDNTGEDTARRRLVSGSRRRASANHRRLLKVGRR